jgi:hypothetical protein
VPRIPYLAAVAAAALLPAPAFACASCGCTLTSDWLSEGLISQPGSAISLRYDYVPQTRLQTGTDTVDGAAIPLPHDEEIERSTYNHYLTLAYDRQFASDWGIDVALPFVARPHRTIAEDTLGVSRSHGSGIGDARVAVRWQGLSTPGGVTGIQAGLVLPTGSFHHTFASGPAAGEEIDRGLQPGSGTFQGVLGVYHYRQVGSDIALMFQAQGQVALDSREGYRPGRVGEASATIKYLAAGVSPQLQLNFRVNGRDSGPAADRPNSGGEQLYIAPGLSVPLGARANLFGLVQLPIYQRVNGNQLVPRVTASLGAQLRF